MGPLPVELGADVIIGVHLLVRAAACQPLPQPLNLLCSIGRVLCWVQMKGQGVQVGGGGGGQSRHDCVTIILRAKT